MKRIVLLFFCVMNYCSSSAQCSGNTNNTLLDRGNLAEAIFDLLYPSNANLNDYAASQFPNPFIDLQQNTARNTKLKILSYLQYDNGLTVYNYQNSPSACFKPNTPISRFEALLYIMEAWNIQPDFSQGSTPFNDINSVNSPLLNGYINRAFNEGIISGSGNFNPGSPLTIGDASEMICEVLINPNLNPVSANLTDTSNYFVPGIYSPDNLAQSRGLNQGVFNHYAKNSFVIPDVKLSLNFSHFYSSTMVELPQGFYPIQPLGRGWSHTYNAYITREDNVGPQSIDFYYLAWPDGTIHVYNINDDEYLSKGVYDELDELSGDRIRITHKDQSRHYFEQLDIARDIWYLIEIRDANGNEITIDYESAEENDTRRIEYVEAPSGKRLDFDYTNNTDYLRRVTDPIGRDIRFDLDETDDNRLEEFTDAMGNETDYRYVENNANAPLQNQKQRYLLDEIRLPRGNKIKAEYDEDNAKLSSYQIDGNDPIEVDVDFDYANNTVTTKVETPIEGTNTPFTETYTFNDNGLVTDYDSDTNNVQVQYPTSGINVMLPTETTSNGVKVEYDFDNRGNVTRIDKENGDIIEEFEYDSDNNLTEYTDGEGNITEFFYDSDENLLEILDASGNSTFFTYDNFGQLLTKTNQEGIPVTYTYEADGAVSTITAPENISSQFTYDGINRLTQRNDNGLLSSYQYDDNDNVTQMINSGGFPSDYTYDTNDNLLSILNPNNIATSFTYDNEDRVISEQFGNLVTSYDYGDEGYLEDMTKPSGQVIDYDYDSDGRLKETGTITDIDYNNRNLVEDITNATGSMDFDYDNLNLLEKVTTVHNLDVEYEYTDTNQVDEIKYPSLNGINLETRYQYDEKNRIWLITLNRNVSSNNLQLAEFEYYDDDRIDYIDLGNGTRITYQYDTAGRFTDILHEDLTTLTPLYNSFNLLNPRGNIIRTDNYFTPIIGGIQTSTGSGTFSGSYDDNSHVVTNNGINHNVDNDGNTTAIGANTNLIFDIDDRLTSYSDLANTIGFKYNPYNQRVEKTINGITTKYVRDVRLDNILVELDDLNNPIYYYIYSPTGMLLARMKPNGDLHYYHGDIRGSVIMMTDDNRAITHQYRYDDFGTITNYLEPASDLNQFRYVGIYGVEHDLNDLYYMRARYYKPSVGRFLTEDPIWSTNLFPYADNNPISKVDPSGNISDEVIDNQIIPALETVVGAYHVGADIIGLVPGLGEWADGYNSLLYSIQGDHVNAGLSAAAMIPVMGWGATVGKYANKISKNIPSSWLVTVAKNKKGLRYTDPNNPTGNVIRVMDGNPKSSNVFQQKPYVKNLSNGKYLDVNGNPLPHGDLPEAHIPINQFKL